LTLSGSIEGLGTKRIFGIHIGINQNPSKSSKSISFIWINLNYSSIILASHSSSSSLLSFTLPLIGITLAVLPLLYYPLLYYLPSILYAIFIFTLLSIEYMVDFYLMISSSYLFLIESPRPILSDSYSKALFYIFTRHFLVVYSLSLHTPKTI